MKSILQLLVVSLVILASSTVRAKDLNELRVIYVGSERAPDFEEFLKEKVADFKAIPRASFLPADAEPFDVVLLDWPQGEEARELRQNSSPLGERATWNKPTVLLGSAGLNLAVAWKLKGGSGCTCMDPLAYDLREHEIFERPFPIDRTKMISLPTPSDFQSEIKDREIRVLPLVENHGRSWKAGWCSYTRDFANNPDVEFFCGGVNQKTPTAAGLWRQGNLLHFGFELSPADMNKHGQFLLLNSIAYISRFSSDRPIAVTPSVFAGPIAYPRATPARWLRNLDYQSDSVKEILTAAIWDELSQLPNRDDMADWCDRNSKFFHPTPTHKLEIDEDLVALGLPFDAPEFVAKNLSDLRSSNAERAARAVRLLKRYVPIGPSTSDAEAWSKWWQENETFAFASDSSDYRWYVDPLAKQRGVPSKKLRGPLRGD
jgi:hypothetical protein